MSALIDLSSWHDALGRVAIGLPPAAEAAGGASARVARFRDIDGRIEQPALDRTVLAVHLGGPKRVIRRQGSHTVEADVAANSFTLMPAGEPFRWETFGPIDFAHLAFDRDDLARLAAEEDDRDPDAFALEPRIGVVDPPLAGLVADVLAAADPRAAERGGSPDRLHRDALRLLGSLRLMARFDPRAGASAPRPRRGTLATWQLRRVVDYMHAHLADDIALGTLVALTGLGRARFFHGFGRSIGRSPFAHLLHLRLLHARRLLRETRMPITAVAGAVGLEPTRLSAAFRRAYGITPSAFRAAGAR